MPSYTYQGLSDEQRARRYAAGTASHRPTTKVDGGAAPHIQEGQRAMQTAELEKLAADLEKDLVKMDATRALGFTGMGGKTEVVVFPKGEAKTLDGDHPLIPELEKFVLAGEFVKGEKVRMPDVVKDEVKALKKKVAKKAATKEK